jgi:hypothetical protein
VILLGMGMAWGGYAMAFWGYCLVKGYDVSFTQVVNPFGFYPLSKPWPPPQDIPSGQILPGGQNVGTTGTSGSATAAGKAVQQQQKKNLQGGAPNPHGTVQ